MNYFCPGSVNTHWGPGPVNTNLVPGPVNTNLVPGPVNTNWGPGPVNTNWGPEPVARARAGGQAKGRGPGNTNTRNDTYIQNTIKKDYLCSNNIFEDFSNFHIN